MDGPTKNARYNRVLTTWGPDSKPECEDCGKDLTGRTVKETRYGWFCVACRNEQIRNPVAVCDEAKAERRQMGLTAV